MPAFPPPLVTPGEINDFCDEAFPGSANRCADIGPGWAVARTEADPALLRPGGIISGPTLFGLADAALWFALFSVCGIEPMSLTSELSIRYLRPARGTAALARADLDHAGRRSVIGTVRMWVEDDPGTTVAVAQGTYVRPRS